MKTSDARITVALYHPQSVKTLSVGLKIEFSLNIAPLNADLLFALSVRPSDQSTVDRDKQISISVASDPVSKLSVPSIDDILKRFGGQSWNNVVDSFPCLKSLTSSVLFTSASLEVDLSAQESLRISSFTISLKIKDLELLDSPKLVVEEGVLILEYSQANGWNGQLETTMLYGSKYEVATRIVLPSASTEGSFTFRNLNDDFTLGALVKEVNSSDAELTTVPLLDSEALSSLRLSTASLYVGIDGGSLSLTGINIEIEWERLSAGNLRTYANMLVLGWRKDKLANVSAIDGSASETTQSTWRIEWEGQISKTWAITASAQFSNILDSDQKELRRLVLSGSILNMDDQMFLSDITNTLTAPTSECEGTLWHETLPSQIHNSFTVRRSVFNCSMDPSSSVFAVGASASWGDHSGGKVVLIVQKTKDEGHPWSFLAAISVHDFKLMDLHTDNELAGMVDKHLVIICLGVCVLSNCFFPGTQPCLPTGV